MPDIHGVTIDLPFAMPRDLAVRGFSARAEDESDLAFLAALYASTRADEVAPLGWDAAQAATFLRQQYDAQRGHYRAHYPDAAFLVIERDGVPVGRLYLQRRGDTLRILDISLLPDLRGRGVGTALLDAVIAQADAAACHVDLFVERFNPALRLYRRLGFVAIGDTGVYLEMRRPARGA